MGKSEENEEEKWLKHYSSNHQILLVGDGDFSFSLCLATSFASAHNILATSLDHYDEVIKKYTKAKSNLRRLQKLGASVLHGVDATKMKRHTDLTYRKFDRIIFNFPHAGFRGREDNHIMINRHRMLVNGFFSNAKSMLRPYGEIHVNHKTTTPFSDWRLDELASGNSLVLIERVEFKIEDYPSYKQKRGDGPRCDQPFPLGESSTFKFRFSPSPKDKIHGKMEQTLSNSLDPDQSRASHITMFDLNTSQPLWRSTSFEYSYPQPNHTRRTNLDYDRVGLPRTNGVRNTQGNFWNPSLPLGAPHANEVGLGFNGDMMTVPPQRSWNRGTHILPEFEERTCYRIESCDTEPRFGYNRDLMMANNNQRAYYGIDSRVNELRYRLSRDSMTMNQDTCILPETNRVVVINREARLSHERHINRHRTEILRIVRTYGN